MRIHLITPMPVGSRHGNAVSASRWASLFEALGHVVNIDERWGGEACDVLIALHARRSHASIAAFRHLRPSSPLIVVLTGTDLYVDLPDDADARRSLVLADRLVALQDQAFRRLDSSARSKLTTIEQSAAFEIAWSPTTMSFQVAVLSHLRAVKDPLLPAYAARLVPASSRLAVRHGGRTIDPALGDEARREMRSNPRYRWFGELDRGRSEALLASSHLLALPSHLEGGANVLCEAIAVGVPVIASRIDGNVGLLGADYAGFHAVGDRRALAELLIRAETDRAFYAELTAQVARRTDLVDPEREKRLWAELLDRSTTRERCSA